MPWPTHTQDLEKELLSLLGRERVLTSRDALIAGEWIVTGNPGFMIQIDSHMRRSGHLVVVKHPIKLLLPPQ